MEEEVIQKQWTYFKELLRSTKRENIECLIKWLDESDFKYAPASTQYHNSFRGGLLNHSLNVYLSMKLDFKDLIDFFEIPEESVIITSLLHDVCKVNCYDVSSKNIKNEEGQWVTVPVYIWNEQEPYGHAEKSIIKIMQCGVQLSNVELAMIRNHMGFTSNDDERRVNKLFRICPQTMILHWADEVATFVIESYDMNSKFIEKKGSRYDIDYISKLIIPDVIEINGISYDVVKDGTDSRNRSIIEMLYNGKNIKVYSPYNDGLPF